MTSTTTETTAGSNPTALPAPRPNGVGPGGAGRRLRTVDDLDARILNVMQEEFPVVRRPYAALAEAAAATETEVLEHVARLKDTGVLRQVSAIWDTRALGYKSMLVAMRAPAGHVDAAAAIVNTHPGVSHNYKRDHEFNIWFTIAVPHDGDLEWCVDRVGNLAGAESVRMLPTLRLFKIGVSLDMTGERPLNTRAKPEYSDEMRASAAKIALSARDVEVVRATQDDLAVTAEPFADGAARLGISQEDLFEELARLRRQGHLRRFAAILRHRRAGFGANGMAVWAVPEERLAEVGPAMASYKVVSHCYQRPVYPDWRFNVFTMIHARKVAECRAVVDDIRESTGIDDYAVLYSTKEYRKIRLRYFTDEIDGWESRQRALAAEGTS